jgi:hypothetical protein
MDQYFCWVLTIDHIHTDATWPTTHYTYCLLVAHETQYHYTKNSHMCFLHFADQQSQKIHVQHKSKGKSQHESTTTVASISTSQPNAMKALTIFVYCRTSMGFLVLPALLPVGLGSSAVDVCINRQYRTNLGPAKHIPVSISSSNMQYMVPLCQFPHRTNYLSSYESQHCCLLTVWGSPHLQSRTGKSKIAQLHTLFGC